MIVGPKYKICRRLGGGVFEKCQTQQFALSEAKHAKSKRRRGQVSDYGRQLIEKQRVRFSYGISERQLRRYIKEAERSKTAPANRLLELLETRLDNIVYRAGLATTRRQARQLVTHGHVAVNGRRVDVPSHQVTSKDAITVKNSSQEKAYFQQSQERIAGFQAPAWLSLDSKSLTIKLLNQPNAEAVDVAGDLGVVLEYYSR